MTVIFTHESTVDLFWKRGGSRFYDLLHDGQGNYVASFNTSEVEDEGVGFTFSSSEEDDSFSERDHSRATSMSTLPSSNGQDFYYTVELFILQFSTKTGLYTWLYCQKITCSGKR